MIAASLKKYSDALLEVLSAENRELAFRIAAEAKENESSRLTSDSFLLIPYHSEKEKVRLRQHISFRGFDCIMPFVSMEGDAEPSLDQIRYPDTWIISSKEVFRFDGEQPAEATDPGREYWLREHALFMEELRRRQVTIETLARQTQDEKGPTSDEAALSRAEFHWKRIGEACRRNDHTQMVHRIEQATLEHLAVRQGDMQAYKRCMALRGSELFTKYPSRLDNVLLFSDSSCLFLRVAAFFPTAKMYSLTLPEEVSVFLIRPVEGGFL